MQSFSDQSLKKLLSQLAHQSPIKHEQMMLKSQFRLHFQLNFIPQKQDEYTLELQLKAGAKRLQLIRQPHLLVKAIAQAQHFSISEALSYDPALYYINDAELSIISMLSRFSSLETYTFDEWYNDVIVLPSTWWQSLYPLFKQSDAVAIHYELPDLPRLEQHIDIDHFTVKHSEKLPVQVYITKHSDDFIVKLENLERLFIAEHYNLASYNQTLFEISFKEAQQLKQLKQLCVSNHDELYITSETKMEFAAHLLPFLNKWFSLTLDKSAEESLIDQPMHAHIYLDRVNEKVLIAVEFHYGPYIIKPFKPLSEQLSKIVIRQMSREYEVLAPLKNIQATSTEEGFIIEGEKDEFLFFYELLPELKQSCTVHATTAIYQRYVQEDMYPEIHLAWQERSNWLDYQFQMDGISEKDIKTCIQALLKKKKYTVLSTGAILSLKQPNYDSLIRVMQQLGLTYPIKLDDRIPLFKAIPLLLHGGYEQSVRANASMRQLLEKLQHPEQFNVALPPNLSGELRDYQMTGFKWFTLLSQFNMGGILADEMGLGKTIQAIAFLAYNCLKDQPIQLVVAPKSLIYNWADELETFAPNLNVNVVEEKEQLAKIEDQSTIIIVSYPFLRAHYKLLAKILFHTIIFDEAQTFKNDHTQTYRAITHLKADNRFALTGTPIENNRDELFHILSVINPSLFQDKQSYQLWTNEQITLATRPFILRRKKSQVLMELPDKIETIVTSALDIEQKTHYASFLAQLKEDHFKHLREMTSKDQQIRILAGITRLRQICCHPSLFVENYTGSSAKFRQLLSIVEQQYKEGKRMLIFSQFTSMLAIIRQELARRGYRYFYLDGQTEAKDRVAFCDRFNQGERDIFLLSMKAGGTGLNLTGANVVILYDSWWNPSVEKQATDRAHRIGQTDTVHIIKLIAEGTIEERMLELHQRKQQLIEQLLDEDQLAEQLSHDELIQLIIEPIHL